MTTSRKQDAVLGRMMDDDGGIATVRVFPSGDVIVTFAGGTKALIARDGTVTK